LALSYDSISSAAADVMDPDVRRAGGSLSTLDQLYRCRNELMQAYTQRLATRLWSVAQGQSPRRTLLSMFAKSLHDSQYPVERDCAAQVFDTRPFVYFFI